MTLRELLTEEPTTIYFKEQTSEEVFLGEYNWDGETLTSQDKGKYTLDQEIVGWLWDDGKVTVYVEVEHPDVQQINEESNEEQYEENTEQHGVQE